MKTPEDAAKMAEKQADILETGSTEKHVFAAAHLRHLAKKIRVHEKRRWE